MSNPKDSFQRPIQDLRISVTDRCNFRCTYCMPSEIFGRDYQFMPQSDLLSFEEIERIARIFASLGVSKLRLTGGEPMMRRELDVLIDLLAKIPDIDDLAMTTNGSFPLDRIEALKLAGLKRLSVSLDALDDKTFQSMNDVDFPVSKVLEWIEESDRFGLGPIKVNMVVKRGENEHAVLPMVRHFKEAGHILRLIEYMDVGSSNGWRLDDVVTAKEIVERINKEFPIRPAQANYLGEVANRYEFEDGSGEIGVIASVSQPFCRDCSRARISADGKLYTCLFAIQGTDLRKLLREGASDKEIKAAISKVWRLRDDRYSELRSSQTQDLPKVEMSYIGG
jgi:cyclic pyranopterin phosphate synthase